MFAYKLVRELKNGELASLFINKKARLPMNEWLDAEDHLTKGYTHRPGWHCLFKPKAPHLSEKGRVWVIVELDNFEFHSRPMEQGGMWILAQEMKIIGKYEKDN